MYHYRCKLLSHPRRRFNIVLVLVIAVIISAIACSAAAQMIKLLTLGKFISGERISD